VIRFVFVAILLFVRALIAAESAGDFDAANRLYEKGDYSGAAAAYQRLAAGGKASAALLFNLGNAYFKSGQVGKAIMTYRHAETLAPRDPDIRANLRFARGSVPGNNWRPSAIDRLLDLLTLNELGAIVAISFWVWFGALAAGQLRPGWKPGLRTWVVLSGIIGILSAAWLAQGIIEHATTRTAVVITPNSAVRFGPLEESQVSFNVRDGNELRVLGHKDAWLQVVDASNRTGWILTNDVAQIR
jgi:tetratricopeptide (TPR) repeat protein